MQILLISPTFSPRTGGLETYVAALSREIARCGHHVVVLTNRDDRVQPVRESGNGVTIVRTSGLLDGNGHANYVPWERAYFSLLTDIAELIDPAEFDVLHCHTQVALLLTHISGLAGLMPVVASFHETNPRRDPLGEQRTRFVLRSCPASAYLVGSHMFAEQAATFGIDREKIRLVHMGVDGRQHASRDAARLQLYQTFGIDPTKVMISLIGRFTERKQHRRLLAAYAEMGHMEDAVVVFAGSDNSTDECYLRQLRDEVAAVADNGVHMLENVTDVCRDLIIDGTDIGTQPSSAEGLGLAAIEFMMASVPILVSDVPGLREAVGADRAALVPTDDPRVFATELDRLTADPQLRAQRGKIMGFHAHARFSIERAAGRTLDVYMGLCEAS